jgi:hypothetical protein
MSALAQAGADSGAHLARMQQGYGLVRHFNSSK